MLCDELKRVGSISHETVRKVLKKTSSSRGDRRSIPTQQNAAFVCGMENVLEVYTRPYDASSPVICMDESSKQCVQEIRPPQGMRLATARYVRAQRGGTFADVLRAV